MSEVVNQIIKKKQIFLSNKPYFYETYSPKSNPNYTTTLYSEPGYSQLTQYKFNEISKKV